jgi:hypothetical protein
MPRSADSPYDEEEDAEMDGEMNNKTINEVSLPFIQIPHF